MIFKIVFIALVAFMVTTGGSKSAEEEEEYTRLRKSYCIYLAKTPLMRKYRLTADRCSYMSWKFGNQVIQLSQS